MYIGVALSIVTMLLGLYYRTTIEKNLVQNAPQMTASEISQLHQTLVAGTIIEGLGSAALWFWMARANSRGARWARVMGTVLFAFYTLLALSTLASYPAMYVAVTAATWGVGLATVVLLWGRDSSSYFRST